MSSGSVRLVSAMICRATDNGLNVIVFLFLWLDPDGGGEPGCRKQHGRRGGLIPPAVSRWLSDCGWRAGSLAPDGEPSLGINQPLTVGVVVTGQSVLCLGCNQSLALPGGHFAASLQDSDQKPQSKPAASMSGVIAVIFAVAASMPATSKRAAASAPSMV